MNWLIDADQSLLLWIQSFGDSAFTDYIMLVLRTATIWIPFYAFVLFFSIRHMRPVLFPFIFLTIACFAFADYGSASILKPFIGRPRPCFTPELQGKLRALAGCGGKYGFPSSHAANHFALATFWYWSIRMYSGRNWSWLFLWAFAIGYAQVYVGKHFPLDFAGGTALGICIGTLAAKIFEKWQAKNLSEALKFPFSLP